MFNQLQYIWTSTFIALRILLPPWDINNLPADLNFVAGPSGLAIGALIALDVLQKTSPLSRNARNLRRRSSQVPPVRFT